MTSHYLKQCWPDSLTYICGTRGRGVNIPETIQCVGRFNINTIFIGIRISITKAMVRLSYLYNWNSYTGKMAFSYWNHPRACYVTLLDSPGKVKLPTRQVDFGRQSFLLNFISVDHLLQSKRSQASKKLLDSSSPKCSNLSSSKLSGI